MHACMQRRARVIVSSSSSGGTHGSRARRLRRGRRLGSCPCTPPSTSRPPAGSASAATPAAWSSPTPSPPQTSRTPSSAPPPPPPPPPSLPPSPSTSRSLRSPTTGPRPSQGPRWPPPPPPPASPPLSTRRRPWARCRRSSHLCPDRSAETPPTAPPSHLFPRERAAHPRGGSAWIVWGRTIWLLWTWPRWPWRVPWESYGGGERRLLQDKYAEGEQSLTLGRGIKEERVAYKLWCRTSHLDIFECEESSRELPVRKKNGSIAMTGDAFTEQVGCGRRIYRSLEWVCGNSHRQSS